MPRYKRSRNEVLEEMNEQIQALRARQKSYDEGNFWECKYIAAIIYTLLHESPNSSGNKAILSQLGMRSSLELFSTVDQPTMVSASYGFDARHTLVVLTMGGAGASFIPKHRVDTSIERKLSFRDWYEESVFYALGRQVPMSRKNLIASLRDQDGGAHYDPELKNETYYSWKLRGFPGLTFKQEEDGISVWGPLINIETGEVTADEREDESPIKGSLHAAMRQISWEVDTALSRLGF